MNTQRTILTDIAQQTLHIDTLETQNSDELDFHEVGVWQIKQALLQAYRAGKRDGSEQGFKEAAGIEDND